MGLSDFVVRTKSGSANRATAVSTWAPSVWNCAVLTPKFFQYLKRLMLYLFSLTQLVFFCFYSPSKSILAAIRTTRRKAVPFMLLEE